MKKFARIATVMLLFMLLFAFAACGEAEQGNAVTIADKTSAAALKSEAAKSTAVYDENNLPPLSERAPGEGRPRREYLLVEGGEVKEIPEFSIDIFGKTFTDKDAASLQLYTANVQMETSVQLHDLVWIGYRLRDVLEYLDLTLDKPFTVEAIDGYSIPFNVEEYDDNVLIAVSRNGKSGDAPYYAPCSDWAASGYINQVCVIRVREEQ